MNGPVQFIACLHYLQDQSVPVTHIPQTPAGMSATAVSDALARAGLHKQQPTQTSGGGWPAPTHAPVCTCPSHRPHESVLPINYHEGPYIPKDIQDQADGLHFNSILYIYLKNTTSYNTE